MMRFVFILTSRVKSESRSYEPDNSPQLVEGPSPGLPDQRTNPAAIPAHTTLSSGPRSLSPSPGSKHPAQPPQTQSLLPPPRPHLGLETTSSSQEFLAGAQADPAGVQPLSSAASDTQHHAATSTAAADQVSSAGPASASSPRLREMSCADESKAAQGHEVKEQPASPSPSSSPLSSSTSCTAPLPLPGPDGARSPSPHFAPLRLTDRPPAASVQNDSLLR